LHSNDESLYRTMKREGKKSIHRERILAYSTVGTPDYIAPEVLSQKVGILLPRVKRIMCVISFLLVSGF
jgi:serine/threonine protein kinase